jgi:antitoxin VapB
MPLNIKDDDTHELARRLADHKGISMAKAVKQALSEAIGAIEADGDRMKADLDRIALALSKQACDRSAEEIIGYDERGLPA